MHMGHRMEVMGLALVGVTAHLLAQDTPDTNVVCTHAATWLQLLWLHAADRYVLAGT